MNSTIDFLREHSSPTPSRWREDAQWRRDNEFWLKYARVITLRVLMSMEEQCVTQAELAKRLGCTQQYVSNLLKGSSNMTIETIARLENALHLDILQSAFTNVDGYNMISTTRTRYLSDTDEPGYGNKKK
ncbi:MAG: helix-turn-helix transcriptional regulator [Bacteroidales bacterium]|nr:helix-turn-helix transcriptional regulator [Bacteroidales bacterium]